MSMMQPPTQPPPQILALLAAAHAAQNGQQGQPQVQQTPDNESPQVAHEEIQIIQQMINLGMKYQQIQPDAEHKATMAKVLMTLHQYMASEQKDAEAALGGGPATRLLRRTAR